MVAKHRRSDPSSLASVGGPPYTGEFEFRPDLGGYGQAAPTARPVAAQATARRRGYPGPAYDDTPSDPGWAAGTDDQSWQEWQDWQAAAAPPVLRPDHPSAQLPQVQLPADHPSGPMWGPRGGQAAGRPARGPGAPPARGPGRNSNSGRHESVTASVGYLTVRRNYDDFEQDPGPARHELTAYQRDAGYQREAGRSGAAEYSRDDGPYGADSTGDWFYDGRSPQPVLYDNRYDGGVQTAHGTQDDATAIRQAAEREATEIRSAAERDAAELRARLDLMLGDLGQVVASYISDTLAPGGAVAAPERPKAAVAAPPRPKAEPRVPRARAALPAGPARPDTAPGTRPDRPAKPRTTPAGPRTATGPRKAPARAPAGPKGKPVTAQQRQGRQKRAMRVAKYGSAALILLALGASGLELHHNGYGFFVFRENGQGDSPSSGPGVVGVDQLDSQFLAAQAAARAKAAHHAPGRHAKTSPSSNGTTATSTTGG